AHDFNNLLTVIKGYSQLLLEETAGTQVHSQIQEIDAAADKAAALTRQLLAFSRQQVLQAKVVDLGQIVGNMQKMLRRLIGEDVELTVRSAGTVGSIFADPGQLEQVAMNLAVNARDAMPRGGKLLIETSGVVLDEAYSTAHLNAPPGRYTLLAV